MYQEGELIADIRRELENEEYPCDACDGAGSFDTYINEFDIHEIECSKCQGIGVLKGDYDDV